MADHDPFRLFRELHDRFGLSGRNYAAAHPALRVREEESCFVLEAEVPGVAPERIELSTENGLLHLRKAGAAAHSKGEAARKEEQEPAPEAFRYSFRLPESVNPEGIQAQCEHGVLSITLPKREQLRARRIPVRPSS